MNKIKLSSKAKYRDKQIQSNFIHEIAFQTLLEVNFAPDPTRCTIVAFCRVLPGAIRCEVTFSNLTKLNKNKLSRKANYREKHIH